MKPGQRIGAVGLALLLGSINVTAAETRNHYIVLERNTKPAYEVTRIHEEGTSSVTRTFLIADPQGPLLRVDVVNDYANRKTIYSYALQRETKESVKLTLDLPFASTTREARREELRKRPELADAPVPVTVAGSSGKKVHGLDLDWRRADTAATVRGKAKDVVGKELLGVLKNVREIGGLPMFADLNPSLSYLFDESMIVRKSMKLMVATVKNDCAFDAKFAVPCAR